MKDGSMPTTEARLRVAARELVEMAVREPATEDVGTGRTSSPVMPPDSIAGRALIGVVAIMSLLAGLTLGAVVLVRAAAGEWQAQVAREITVQVRPTDGRDGEADVAQAVAIVRATPGVATVHALSKSESSKLLEPWLGTGLSLDELPVPRMIVVTLATDTRPDLDSLRRALSDKVPGASVDDHRGWVQRMRVMTRLAVVAGMAILGLVLGATVLMVIFATQGAMATNKGIIEVLHFVGAKNRYISAQFQRHFLLLGLKGAAIGGGLALAFFLGMGLFGAHLSGMVGDAPDAGALFGSIALGPDGYAGVFGLVVLVAAATALTSRVTVIRTLGALE
jgi:cell division transport system permease protein